MALASVLLGIAHHLTGLEPWVCQLQPVKPTSEQLKLYLPWLPLCPVSGRSGLLILAMNTSFREILRRNQSWMGEIRKPRPARIAGS